MGCLHTRIHLRACALVVPAVICAAVILTFAGAARAQFRIVEDGRPVTYIAVHPDRSPGEQRAAEMLAGRLADMTGATIPVRAERYADIPPNGRAVVLGVGEWLRDERFDTILSDLFYTGRQGYVIQHFPAGDPDSPGPPEILLITAATPRGLLYAVQHLVRLFGGTMTAPGEMNMPASRSVRFGETGIIDLPCFTCRSITGPACVSDSTWRRYLRLTETAGDSLAADSVYAPLYVPLAVNAAELVPAAVTGPVDTDAGNPVCLTDAAVMDFTADWIRERLERHPATTDVLIRGVSSLTACTCPACSALVERDGCVTGVAIAWLNGVADRLERRYPLLNLVLEADGGLGQPPAVTRPGPRVVVALDTGDIDTVHPFADSIDPDTLAFTANLAGWRQRQARVWVTQALGDSTFPLLPRPDLAAIGTAVDTYHEQFVEGLCFAVAATPDAPVFQGIGRSWLLGELMWNRYRDIASLRRQWLRDYYGDAWSAMEDAWEHVDDLAELFDAGLPDTETYCAAITAEWLDEADRILQRAYALSMADPAVQRRVREARACFRFARLARAWYRPGEANRERCLRRLGEWEAEYAALGYARVSSAMTAAEFADRLRERLAE